MSHFHHIQQGGVGAGADANLIDLQLADLCHGLDIVRRMRTCSQGHQFAQINVQFFIINCIGICLLFAPDFASALCFEELLGHLVRRENRSGRTQFCTHVGNGCTFRNRQSLDTLAAVFNDLTDTALYGHATQYFQNDIFCRYPRGQLAGQLYLYHLRTGNVVSTAAHCHCNVQTAGTHRDHTDTAASRGMAVRADQSLSRNAETLQMYLMADTVAGTGKINAVLLCNAADKAVVICIFKAVLEGVVVDVCHAAFCTYTRNAHCLKFQICHCTGCVLCQGLVDPDSDFGTLYHFTFHQMCFQDLFRQGQSHSISFLS